MGFQDVVIKQPDWLPVTNQVLHKEKVPLRCYNSIHPLCEWSAPFLLWWHRRVHCWEKINICGLIHSTGLLLWRGSIVTICRCYFYFLVVSLLLSSCISQKVLGHTALGNKWSEHIWRSHAKPVSLLAALGFNHRNKLLCRSRFWLL